MRKPVSTGLKLFIGLATLLGLFLIARRVAKRKQAAAVGLALSKYRKLIPQVEKLARFETGNYSSALYNDHHNLFGMGVATQRKQVRNGSVKADGNRDVATYKNDVQSISDMKLYLDYMLQKNPISIDSLTDDNTFISWLEKNGWRGYGNKMDAYRKAFQSW